jgi:hypothetical protein
MYFSSLPDFPRVDSLQLPLTLVLVCRETLLRPHDSVPARVAVVRAWS